MWVSVVMTAQVRWGRQLGRSGRGIGSNSKRSALTCDRLLVPTPDIPPASRGKRPNGSIRPSNNAAPSRPVGPERGGGIQL